MSYAGNLVINDADSHLMELPDFLTLHADPADAAQVADLAGVLNGQFDPGQVGATGHDPAVVKKLLALADDITKGPKWHNALGACSGAERGQALDLLGFQHQVVFSSFCARLIFAAANDDIAYASAAAHNRAVAAFCAADPRLLGVAMVPLQDVERALQAINTARELGLAAVWIAAEPPGGRSPGHVAHEPIWSLLAASGMPFILHVGSAELSIAPAWMADGRDNTVSARGGAEVIGSKDLTAIHFPMQRFISIMILDGVLERHPGLRGAVVELGAGWVPDMLRRLDHAVAIWARSEPQLADMSRLPSTQAAQQLCFTPYPFEDVGQLVSESSEDLYMFSTDYPHAEGGRDPLGRFRRSTEQLSEQAREKFFAGNFATVYAQQMN